jgi:hypothetical protein
MFVHSCYTKAVPSGGDAVVVKEHVHHPDGRVEPKLSVIRNPQRKFMVTKKANQTHQDKKEAAPIKELDIFTVENNKLEVELFRVLNGYYPRGRANLRDLCNSPYVYGADIAIETLIKQRYQADFKAANGNAAPVTTGFLDTETSVLAGDYKQLTIISVTHETQVYTAIRRQNFFYFDDAGKRHEGDLEGFDAFAKGILQPALDEVFARKEFAKHQKRNNFTYEFFVGETSLDLLKWIFSKMHGNKTDFVGVWNLDYDINVLLQTFKEAKLDPCEVMCPPELPKEYRFLKYDHDDKKVDHITKKWHWLHCTAYYQMYDAMCLYSTLRTVIGKEVSYALDHILKKNGVGGKLYFKDLPDLGHLSGTDWHRFMQSRMAYHYIVYNMWDVISIQLMEYKNQDVQSMFLLSGVSSLAKYTRQTRKAADTLYFDWLARGRVLASPGKEMVSQYDHLIPKVGGAVLRPERMDYNGLYALVDKPNLRTMLHCFVNDVDFSAMYPTVTMASNISKETKRSTILAVLGAHVQKRYHPQQAAELLYGHLVSIEENAVHVAEVYFGLPNYAEMDVCFSAFLANENAIAEPLSLAA